MTNFDDRLALMCGSDLPIVECQLTAHQPRLYEIALIGEKNFFAGTQCLCLSKRMFEEDKNLLENTTNFQIFMTILSQAKEKCGQVFTVLELLFPGYKPMLLPSGVLSLQHPQNSIIIDDSNFEALQSVLKKIFCVTDAPMDQQSFNPVGKKAKAIADKIMEGRKKVAEAKGLINVSVFSQYISTLVIGLHMTIEELSKLTMFQLYDLIERFMLYVDWDIDLRSRLAGAQPDEHPENWMKNIH